MPQVVSHLSGAQWEAEADAPKTPTQRFIRDYVKTVQSGGYNTGSGLKYYAKDSIFHNQNNAVYHGGDEIWPWMQKLFGLFPRVKHDCVSLLEIEHDDGTSQIYHQNIRKLWLDGNNEKEPTVSVPITLIAIIGKSDNEESPEGLQFKEVWLYWDTALLIPFFPKDSVVFSTKNVVRENKE